MVASSQQSNGVETSAERRKKVAAEIGHSTRLQATSKLAANKKKQSATITGDDEKKKKKKQQQELNNTNGKWRQVDAEREPDQQQQPVQAKVKTRSGLLGALLGTGGAGSRHTILSIQNGAPTTRATQDQTTKEKSTAAGAQSQTLGKETSSKYSGLPTFGSVPQKLNNLSNSTQPRVPYFSYHGNARNLKQHHSLASSRQLSSSCSQLSSTQSTSSSSSASSSASNQIKIPVNKQQASRKASLLGFSNLSNLFPGEPRRLWPARNQPAANSISDTRKASQQKVRATMRRVNTSSQQHLAGSGSSLVGGPGKLMGGAPGGRLRPASASGHYNTMRSPSYRLGSAGMSPLVDPDCPMHGDGPPPPAAGGGRGTRYTPTDEHYEQQQQQRDNNTRSRYHSASQPDLLYNNDATAMTQQQSVAINDDPYNARTSGGGGAFRGSPIYGQSQLSPSANYEQANNWTNNQQHESRRANYNAGREFQQPAYYNGQSRFSQYHATGDGRIGSSLAPTSEQLRRILGYKPPGYQASKPVHLHPQWAYTRPFIHLQPAGSGFGRSPSPAWLDDEGGELGAEGAGSQPEVPKFAPFNRLQDNQAIRAVDFHPSGEVYAIGSNSRALRICAYPAEHELRHFDPFDDLDQLRNSAQQATNKVNEKPARPPRVLFKFLQVHRGSIYCVSFNPSGQLLATGSNDQTIHIVKYNSVTHNPDGEEFRLTMHNGTIRDLCFIDDSTGNGSSLLLSAGGGDNKIYVTDCDTITPFQSMAGHTQMVMALNHCGGAQFVSGSYDRTIRFWDLRSRSCTSIVSAPPLSASGGGTTNTTSGGGVAGPGAPVCALRVDPSGRLLVSGHTDTTCMLYDIRGGKIIQTFRPHDDEIRAISFSPKSYYLLTGGYDGRLVVSDLQGDLTQPLPSVCVAQSQDKIVQAKWHPADFTFVSTSADKSATLWSLPGEIRN